MLPHELGKRNCRVSMVAKTNQASPLFSANQSDAPVGAGPVSALDVKVGSTSTATTETWQERKRSVT